ncbi:winged helix DNA-binding domain-containing protein [Mucilaginibacter sp. BJC16-A38]|uniref:winged helix DNA-binding domain-containing protein n=1 Tax=Mucilaginibacter phenanthrenivorans TaxID=1234842 RepID=UPI002157AD6E|nr:winged helix DNA-binding domain-containing protein [Mucilaginibacter phenanthrenivorans]MCR8557044.1 winged helix DNA-binding domain-containing protein [Mucilaginibacter phenanthrenivorans]
MTNLEIAHHRLYTQHIAHQQFSKPAEIVKYMGAMQAQDYAGAKWAVGMRLKKINNAAIDMALADGSIIRTHVLRPTWHFVDPDDLRWMLDLTAHRIVSLGASRTRQLQLDNSIFKKSNDALARALEGNKQLDRFELTTILNNAGVKTDTERLIHLLMQAELERVICSGGRQGKQFTYALFDDRVPQSHPLDKEEALAELLRRYIVSRGPATLHDFAWWSGLTLGDARLGLEIVKSEFISTMVSGHEYWMAKDKPEPQGKAPIAYLLPAYDEFAVAYSDRAAAVNPKYTTQARHVIFDPSIVVNNQVVGAWRRIVKKNEIEIVLNPFGKLNKIQTKAIDMAQKRFQKFMKY